MFALSCLVSKKVQRLKESEQDETKRNLLSITERGLTDATTEGSKRFKREENAQKKSRRLSGSQTGPSSTVLLNRLLKQFGVEMLSD